jgi:integrase
MCFMRACRKAGIRDFSFHDCRHAHAGWLRRSGVSLDLIARQLGPKDLRMAQPYAHIAATQVRDAVERSDRILSKPESAPGARLPAEEPTLTLVN